MKIFTSTFILVLLAILLVSCSPAGPPSTSEPQPTGSDQDVVFIFRREGGIAGFCDDIIVYLNGEAEASSCAGQELGDPVRVQLTPDQQANLTEWVGTLQPFEFVQTDPATADALTIRIQFSGTGERAYTDADIQAIQELAQDLLARAMPTP